MLKVDSTPAICIVCNFGAMNIRFYGKVIDPHLLFWPWV